MSMVKSLNSDGSIEVVTFYGGPDRGRCYDFIVKGRHEATLTETQLLSMLALVADISATVENCCAG